MLLDTDHLWRIGAAYELLANDGVDADIENWDSYRRSISHRQCNRRPTRTLTTTAIFVHLHGGGRGVEDCFAARGSAGSTDYIMLHYKTIFGCVGPNEKQLSVFPGVSHSSDN